MSKINCLIVDDEPLAKGLLEKHIAQFPQLNLVGSCWNAIEALEVMNQNRVDLIFLDIQMPGVDGIQFLRSLQRPPSVVFTTAFREYAVESYELNVIDYLLKPITIDRFLQAINKYYEKGKKKISLMPVVATQEDERSYMYVSTNRKHIKVEFVEMLYIESMKDYIRIVLRDKEVITKAKIGEFLEELPDHFIRVHRSFAVNTQRISGYTAHDIEIEEKEIPIGISYKKEVIAFLERS